MANTYKQMEIIPAKGIPGKKSSLTSNTVKEIIVTHKECSSDTKIPNTQNSLLIK